MAGLTGVHSQGSRVKFNHVPEINILKLTLIKFCDHLILPYLVLSALFSHDIRLQIPS